MASFFRYSLAIAFLGCTAAVGCGDDDSDTTPSGSGGAGGTLTTTTTGGQPGTGGNPVTTSTTGGTGGESTGGTGGTPIQCSEITVDDLKLVYSAGPFAYQGHPARTLGGADEDVAQLEIYDETVTGSVDLSAGDDANYATCMTCLLALEDIATDGSGAAKIYFQASGTLDYGATTPPFIAGSATDVTLVEVTIDPDSFESTPVAGGACLHLATMAFDIMQPPAGWVCPPEYYGDGSTCDCLCGAVDSDCADAALPVGGCQEGQTCSADGTACQGVPTAWTCAADQYGGGAGNGCDCNCGAHDPDCDLAPAEPIQGCAVGDTCNINSVCLSPAWTCDDDYFGGNDGCDCGCGVVDIDCADATVGSCEFCNDTGSCSTDACPGTINATNNAVCG
jgi:hypothetical protein